MLPRFLIDFSYPDADYITCTDEYFGFIAEASLVYSPFEETQPAGKKDFYSQKLTVLFTIIQKKNTNPENEESFDSIVSLAMEFYQKQALKHYSLLFDCLN